MLNLKGGTLNVDDSVLDKPNSQSGQCYWSAILGQASIMERLRALILLRCITPIRKDTISRLIFGFTIKPKVKPKAIIF